MMMVVRIMLLMMAGLLVACGAASPAAAPTATPEPVPAERLLFASSSDGFESELMSIAPDGSDLQGLVSAGTVWDENGRYDPAGVRVAFNTRQWYGNSDLWLIDGAGSVTKLTDDTAQDAYPLWSPDGSQLLFVSSGEGFYDTLFLLDIASGARQVLWQADSVIHSPDWSPDGTRIVFTRLESGSPSQLYSIASDGSDLRQLTDVASNHQAPRWSPDGSEIAFASTRDGQIAVYVMDAAGGTVRLVAAGGDGKTNPVWSPDGTRLAYNVIINAPMTMDAASELRLSTCDIAIMDLATGDETIIYADGAQHILTDWVALEG